MNTLEQFDLIVTEEWTPTSIIPTVTQARVEAAAAHLATASEAATPAAPIGGIPFQTSLTTACALGATLGKPVLLFLDGPGCQECSKELEIWTLSPPLHELIVSQTVPCWLNIYNPLPPALNPVTVRFVAMFPGASLPIQLLMNGALGAGSKPLWAAPGCMGASINLTALQNALRRYQP